MDAAERDERVRFVRDVLLVTIGSVGVVGIGIAAVFVQIQNESLALAVLAVFASFLGAPTFLRIDEKKNQRASGDRR